MAKAQQGDAAGQCAEGVRLYQEGDKAAALPLLEAGFAGREQATFDHPVHLVNCALLLGNIRHTQGNYSAVLTAYQVALTSIRESQTRTGEDVASYRAAEGRILTAIGSLYRTLGQFNNALTHYQQAQKINQNLGNRAEEGEVAGLIGDVYTTQEQYGEAMEQFQQAHAIALEIGNRDAESTALSALGNIRRLQGNYPQALQNLQEALDINRAEGNRTSEATTLNSIGLVYRWWAMYGLAPNDNERAQNYYQQALTYYQQALAIYKETENRVNEGLTLSNIGRLYRNLGRPAESLDALQQALIIDREVGNPAQTGMTLSNMGRALHELGRDTEAMETYTQAIEVMEQARAVAGDEEGRAGFINQYVPMYERAAKLAHRLNQDERAFDISERGRARAFLDSLATGQIQFGDQAVNALLERELATYAARQTLQQDLVRAQSVESPDPAQVADFERHLKTAEEQHAQSLAAITQYNKQLAAMVSSSTLKVADVQARLDPLTTLVSFFVTDDQTLVFILRRDHFSTHPLDVTRSGLRKQVQALMATPDFQDSAHPTESVELYTTLIDPIKQYLTTPHLALIAHGPLHYLPFAALSNSQQLLGDEYVLSTLPSASALPFIQSGSGRVPQSPLILANSDGSLPRAEQEARAIADLYGTKALLRHEATEMALREQVAQAGILHVASHGEYKDKDALSSVLKLAASGNDQAQGDGQLEAAEVYGLNLQQAALVVLSACETNLGEVSAGDEVVGLTRAFFFAGTPTVISSLWRVDDEATAELMTSFYRHLRAGMGKAEALREAQREVRASKPGPFYWAGFVLAGDTGTLEHARSTYQRAASQPIAGNPETTDAAPESATRGESTTRGAASAIDIDGRSTSGITRLTPVWLLCAIGGIAIALVVVVGTFMRMVRR